MSVNTIYPKREPYFAHRFIRLMTKTALAMEVGVEGFCLLTLIVMQEDSCRYTKPVNFWNTQLMNLMGMKKDDEKRFRRVRDRCIEQKWLRYWAGSRSKPAKYYVTIPEYLNTIPDGPCDESENIFVQQNGTETAQCVQVQGKFGPSSGQVQGKFGPPSIPLPIPTPERERSTPSLGQVIGKEIRKAGLPASKEAIQEWVDILAGAGCAEDDLEQHIRAIRWILSTAKKQGVNVQYAKHAQKYADLVRKGIQEASNAV